MTVAFPASAPTPANRVADRPLPSSVLALVAALRQLLELVEGMTDEQYTRRPKTAGGSIGGHVRHNLDHVSALLVGLPTGAIDYDRRERGTPVETDRRLAAAALEELERRLADARWGGPAERLRVTALVSPDLPPIRLETSWEREVAFVLSHTIHHNALIGLLAALVDAPVPPGFGYAPSTLAYQRGLPPAGG